MQKRSLTAVILSAGHGRRMKSSVPKSLHPVAGKPMLVHILQALKIIDVKDIRVVIRPEHERLIRPVADAFKAKVYFQEGEKAGTAISIQCAGLNQCKGDVLIVNGDHPLIVPKDLRELIKQFYEESADLCIASFQKNDPGDYGRVIRKNQNVVAIVERDSLTHESRKIKEVNAGLYLSKSSWLEKCLSQIKNHNTNKEYYLTDVVSISASQNKNVIAVPVSVDTAFGVNTQKELAFASKKIFNRKLNQLMDSGVIIVDPLNTYIEENVTIGQGSVVYPGVYLKGLTSIGSFCAIEVHSYIMDSVINDMVLIRAGSYLESVTIGRQSQVGPYTRLRPGTQIGEECQVGNFVEMKKTQFGSRSKAGHFSYLGDSEVGEDVNIGCGVVTSNLNLNGKKYQTKIRDQVFVGSGTHLVAPVELGEGSATGAGSVIVKDVPEGTLAVSRTEQKNRENYFSKKNKPGLN